MMMITMIYSHLIALVKWAGQLIALVCSSSAALSLSFVCCLSLFSHVDHLVGGGAAQDGVGIVTGSKVVVS